MTLTPAYGRDYKSKKEVLADFLAGNDFRLETYNASGYCSKSDFPVGTRLQLRYKKLTQVVVYTITGKE